MRLLGVPHHRHLLPGILALVQPLPSKYLKVLLRPLLLLGLLLKQLPLAGTLQGLHLELQLPPGVLPKKLLLLGTPVRVL